MFNGLFISVSVAGGFGFLGVGLTGGVAAGAGMGRRGAGEELPRGGGGVGMFFMSESIIFRIFAV